MNNTPDRELVVGDRVELVEARRADVMGGGYGGYNLERGQTAMVTRVYREEVVVRGYFGGNGEERSAQVRKDWVQLVDPNRPQPRRPGQKPEDTEEMTYLDQNDPRLAWLWEDMGAYATGKNWCGEYDAICARLGLPGRPREFTVRRTVGGVELRASLMAHSQAEANKAFERALADAGNSAPDPDPGTTSPEPDFPLAA